MGARARAAAASPSGFSATRTSTGPCRRRYAGCARASCATPPSWPPARRAPRGWRAMWGARGEVGLAPPAVPALGESAGAHAAPLHGGLCGQADREQGAAGPARGGARPAGPGGAADDRQRRAARSSSRASRSPARASACWMGSATTEMASRLRPAGRARAALAHDGDLEGAVRPRDHRGAVVRRPGGRLGLGRDPLADRADGRRADLPRGRPGAAARPAGRAAQLARAARAAGAHGPRGGRADVHRARGHRPARGDAAAAAARRAPGRS